MGWTTYSIYNSPQTHAEEKREVINLCKLSPGAPYTLTIEGISKVNSIWFVAAKFTPKEGQTLDGALTRDFVVSADGSVTTALVFLTNHYQNQWGYKDMTESMGPADCYARCPNSILKKLSELQPHDSNYAVAFRESSKAWNNRPKLKPGMKIKLDYPATFNGLGECTNFEVIDAKQFGWAKKKMFRALDFQHKPIVSLRNATLRAGWAEVKG